MKSVFNIYRHRQAISFLVFTTTIICAAPSFSAPYKKDPCLKNNNGIGNNHDVFVELPTNSLSLEDEANEILSIRIDPGNSGQVKKFKLELTEKGFDIAEVNFVITQLLDAEKKLKDTGVYCLPQEPDVDIDYSLKSIFAD
jgi:hypothetical protein